MEYSDDESMWLTQEPSLDSQNATFDIGFSYIEEDLATGNDQNVVSLEENSGVVLVLYDNVMAENISLDECIDTMQVLLCFL